MVEVTLRLGDRDYDALKEHVGKDGAAIHSVDQVNVKKT